LPTGFQLNELHGHPTGLQNGSRGRYDFLANAIARDERQA
jgi:hypothetical protein